MCNSRLTIDPVGCRSQQSTASICGSVPSLVRHGDDHHHNSCSVLVLEKKERAKGERMPCSLLPAPCYLLPAPCYLLPAPFSLLPSRSIRGRWQQSAASSQQPAEQIPCSSLPMLTCDGNNTQYRDQKRLRHSGRLTGQPPTPPFVPPFGPRKAFPSKIRVYY